MLTRKHPFFNKFKEIMTIAARNTPVYDLGTSGRFAKEMAMVEKLFKNDEYFAGGYMPDNLGRIGGCDLHCDLESIDSISDGAAGCIITLSVLEHIRQPERALREINRVLRPNGVFVASVPFLWPYHGKSDRLTLECFDSSVVPRGDAMHSAYPDYWRFTHECLLRILIDAGFSKIQIYPIDGRIICRLQLMGLSTFMYRVPGLLKFLNFFDKPRLGRSTSMHWVVAYK